MGPRWLLPLTLPWQKAIKILFHMITTVLCPHSNSGTLEWCIFFSFFFFFLTMITLWLLDSSSVSSRRCSVALALTSMWAPITCMRSCCLCSLGFFCSFFFGPKDHVALSSRHWPSLTHLFSSLCLLSKDMLYGHSQPVWLSIEIAVRIYIFTEFGNSLLTAIFTLAVSLHSLFNINSLQ